MKISDISTGNITEEGVANHALTAYEFSQFFPYSDPVQSEILFEREWKTIPPKKNSYDNASINVLDSEYEA